MSGRKVILGLFILGVMFAAGLWGAKRIFIPAPRICLVCARAMREGQEFRMHRTDGAEVVACCPPCGMYYDREHPGEVKRIMATDFVSSTIIRAQDATYLETASTSFCAERARKNAGAGIAQEKIHRCTPALIAFRNREDAERYWRMSGGRIFTFEESLGVMKRR